MITLVSKICLAFFITLLLLCVFAFFGVPVYRFADPTTFTGPAIYNPYHNLDTTRWIKANFHAHQREKSHLAQITYTTKELVDSYKALDYDIIGVSDHQYLNYQEYDRSGFIPTYEHGYGLNRYHQLLIGVSETSMRDFPVMLTRSQMQYILHAMHPQAEVLVLNHPGQTRLIDHKFYSRLRGYDLLEINPDRGRENSIPCWDTALSAGIYSNLIANDDAHDIVNRDSWVQRTFTMISTPSVEKDSVLGQLKKGAAYGVYLPHALNKRPNPHEGLPTVRSVGMHDGGQLYLRVSEPATIRFVGQGGRVLSQVDNTTQAAYDFAAADTYVRMEATFPNGVILFLNPFVRTHYVQAIPWQPVNEFIPVINYPMSLLTHVLWVSVSLLLMLILLRIVGVRKWWTSVNWAYPMWLRLRLFPDVN